MNQLLFGNVISEVPMKKIVIISNEDSEENNGEISLSNQFGLGEKLFDIPNLISTISSLGNYQINRIHHLQIEDISKCCPDYVVLSGRFSRNALSKEEIADEYSGLIEWIKHTTIPTFGICMGHQLICAAFGVDTIPLYSSEGEFGFTELKRIGAHPLTETLPATFYCMEMHRCQVTSVPEGFKLIASSEKCPVQMIAHQKKPIISTQFHPELTTDKYQDGLILLKRFFDIY